MKKIFAITLKDTIVRFTSPIEWVFFLVLPIIFTVVVGASSGPSDDDRVKMIVVDQANNALSETLITSLEASSSVKIEIREIEDASSALEQKKISSVLIIPENFNQQSLVSQNAELELQQLPNNTEALIAQQAVQAVLSRVSSVVDIANGSVARTESLPGFKFESEAARQVFFDSSLEKAQALLAESPNRITEEKGKTKDSVEFDPRSNASAGQLITWVFIPLIGLSGSFAYERQKGTLRRLLTTPTSKGLFLTGTIIGQVMTAIVQMLLLVLFGIFVMKLNWAQAPLALAIMLISSALAAAALGTMVGTFVKTESQANGLSIMIGMVMALMGGCWYPLEFFPQTVQQIVKVLPTTWAMQGLLDIVLRGQGLMNILPEAGVLLGFTLIFMIIGILRFKYE
ncbi:MAG: ABC transporter permease [Anaerolineaceae bacterium]|nr:ABC transporter permease [Anaerolineaceae bacterium]